jgi:hypothetical protein
MLRRTHPMCACTPPVLSIGEAAARRTSADHERGNGNAVVIFPADRAGPVLHECADLAAIDRCVPVLVHAAHSFMGHVFRRLMLSSGAHSAATISL